MIYADLHVHTNHSDGTNEIEDVFKKASESGIKVIAITDHDTLNHYEEVLEVAKKYNIRTIRGVEMSCYDFEVNKKVHVVGLFLDQVDNIKKLCDNTLEHRNNYHKKLIKELNEKGFDITYEDCKKFSPYNIVFKMHIFLALKEKYKDEFDFKRYRELFAGKTTIEVDREMGYIDVKEGIEAILKDGGLPVLAHPCEYDNYNEVEKYVSYGIKAVEISHMSMKEVDYEKVNDIVNKYHLLASGGSDYHDESITKFGVFGLTKEQFEKLEYDFHTSKVINFRELSGYQNKDGKSIKKGMIYRGGSLDKLNNSDIDYFEETLKIQHILDFRSDEEKAKNPDVLFDKATYYHHQALKLESTSNYYDFINLGINKESLSNVINMLKEGYELSAFGNKAYKQMFDYMLEGKTFYFHCTAGKDRTGMAGLLIMLALGMSEEDAIVEYMKSNEALETQAIELAKRINLNNDLFEMSKPLLLVFEEYIRTSIDAINKKYSSYEEFFEKEYSLDERALEKIRSYYLE